VSEGERQLKPPEPEWLVPLSVKSGGELVSHRFHDADAEGVRRSLCSLVSEYLVNLTHVSDSTWVLAQEPTRRCERCIGHTHGSQTLRKIRAAYDTGEA
jgi:hypothetical protein